VVVVAVMASGKPLLSPNWFRVASVQPRLHAHVRITRHHFRGERWFVLEDLAENRVHRYAPAAQQAIALMDGRHTLDEIWQALASLGEERPTQDEMLHLMAQLDGASLLATERLPDMAELADRAQRTARSKRWRRVANPLYIRIPLLDPDRFLNATAGLLRPLASVWGLLLWLGVVGWGVAQASLHWNELTTDLADRVLARDNLLILALTFPVLKLLHELGHCYAAKFGGAAVHEAGIMTLIVMPVPYVDVTGATAFPDKWHRALVGAAGMIVETFCAGLAMMVWTHVEPGLARAAAFNVMLIAGVSTLIFNGNPLLRFDAYFILSDLIEIPNLGTRAMRYWGYLVNRYAFGVQGQTSPVQARGERPWFLLYAPASFGYRIWVMVSIALFVAAQLHGVGTLLAVWTVAGGILFPIGKGLWHVACAPALRAQRLRAVLVTGGAIGFATVMLFAVKLPYGTTTQGVVWTPPGADLRAGVEGQLTTLQATAGQALAPGATIGDMADPVLGAKARLLEAQLQEVRLRYDAASQDDRVQAAMLRSQISYFTSSLQDARTRLAALKLTTPVAGTFLVTTPEDLPGRFERRGDLIGYAFDGNAAIVRVIVPQSEIALVRDDTRGIELRFASDPMRVLHVDRALREIPTATRQLPSEALATIGGGPFELDPADDKHQRALEVVFQLDVKLPEGTPVQRIGERVYVRFSHEDRALGWRIARSARQLFLKRFDL
jgi:putative peptide zinc metalloprotease protein